MLRFCSNCMYFQFPSVCCADPLIIPNAYDFGCACHETLDEFYQNFPFVPDFADISDFDDDDLPF